MTENLSALSSSNDEAKLSENDNTIPSPSASTHVKPSPSTNPTSGITSASASSPSPLLRRENSSHIRRLSSSSSFSFNPSNQSSRRTSLIPGLPIHSNNSDKDMASNNSLGSPGFAPGSVGSEVGVGLGPGPQRYPKPRTAADLHLEMEQEQEAVVNRLTRELLRVHNQANFNQQSSPSTSSAAIDDPPTPASSRNQDPTAPPYYIYGGSTTSYPRHNRAPSATSTTNATAGNLSRQGSMKSMRSVTTGGRNTPPVGESPITFPSSASVALSPGMLPPGWGFPPYAAYGYHQPISAPGSELNLPLGDTPGFVTRNAVPLAETIQLKKQMEQALQENDELRQKIRALEKELRGLGDIEPEGWGRRTASSAVRGRSRSPSVTRSTHRGRTREVKRSSPPSAPTVPLDRDATSSMTSDIAISFFGTVGEGNKGVNSLSESLAAADLSEQTIRDHEGSATKNQKT